MAPPPDAPAEGGEFSILQGLSALVRPLVWQRCTVSASVRVGKRTTAVFSGIEFGPNTYFIQGACRVPNNGTAWHMFLILLRDAFERSPHGKFIMGANNEAAGPTRFQQECRTSAYLTSIVQFTYRNSALKFSRLVRSPLPSRSAVRLWPLGFPRGKSARPGARSACRYVADTAPQQVEFARTL